MVFPLGVEQLGHKSTHSPQSGTKVNNEWSYTSTPPYALMACTGTTLAYIYLSQRYWNCTLSSWGMKDKLGISVRINYYWGSSYIYVTIRAYVFVNYK
jgi:hypothetical protein